MFYVLVTAAVMGLVPHHELLEQRGTVCQRVPRHFLSWHLARKVHRGACRHLGHRRPQWLDPDRYRDLPGGRTRRSLSAPVRLVRSQRNRLVRHSDRHRAAFAAHALALHNQLRVDRIHLSCGPDCRDGSNPIFHVGDRPTHLPGLASPGACRDGSSLATCRSLGRVSCSRCGLRLRRVTKSFTKLS